MVDGLRERIDAWSDRSVPDGLTGLQTLAEQDFDGVVTAGAATATFVSGRVLHLDGDIEAMEELALTAKESPEPELALLCAMTATGGDAQAQYYTEDTDISSIDERLQSGGFTGYVELAENVLSGSYYRLYYAGTARSLAFVGINDDVLTGTEAFDRTLEEVGIYEVVPIDLSVTDLPEPPAPTDTAGSAVGNSDAGDDASADAEASPAAGAGADDSAENAAGTRTSTDSPGGTDAGGASDLDGESGSEGASEGAGAHDLVDGGAADAGDDGRTDAVDDGTADAGDTTTLSADDRAIDLEDVPAGDSESVPEDETTGSVLDPRADDDPDGGGSAGADGVADTAAEDGLGGDGDGFASSSDADSTAGATESAPLEATETDAVEGDDTTPNPPSGDGEVGSSGVSGRSTESAASGPTGASTDAETVGDRQDELEELRRRVATLEQQFQTLEDRTAASSGGLGGDGSDTETTTERSPTEALGATDCLLRYETRAGATIEELLEGNSTAEAVRENLRVETNTTLDTESVTVEGVPYEEFFAASLERRVVGWLLCELPSEIVATDSQSALGDLVDVLPTIDRIGFQESIDLGSLAEEPPDEEAPESVEFDLVAWGGDGHPRVVADLSRSADPVGEGPVSSLIARGKSVASQTDLAAVLFATEGYYEADARQAVEATTGGGLLARNNRASYVKMPRKRGFHCCLAEAYDDAIHLTVPEL
jgi:hypothetical protein